MVVDDDSDMRELLEDVLQEEGYEVESVENGQTCLERIRDFSPHMLLLDIMMPGMDGWQVLEELGWQTFPRNLKVVMLTARPLSEKDTKRQVFLHVAHYIRKPFTLAEIGQTIEGIFHEEESIKEEIAGLSRTMREEFISAYSEIITASSRKRRICSQLDERRCGTLGALKDLKSADDILETVTEVQERLCSLKGFFNPMAFFFYYGLEKELKAIREFLQNVPQGHPPETPNNSESKTEHEV